MRLALLAGMVLFLAPGQRHAFGLHLLPVTTEWGWRSSYQL